MDWGTHICRTRRLLAALGAVGLFAAAGAPTAFADVGLSQTAGSLPSTPATEPVSETGAQATEPVTQVLPSQTAQDATATTESVVETAPEAVTEPVQSAAQTVNSAVETAQEVARDPASAATQSVAPARETAQKSVGEVVTPTVDAVEDTLRGAETTLTMADPLADDALRSASSAIELLEPTVASRDGAQAEAAPVADTAAALVSPQANESSGTGGTPAAVTTPRAAEVPRPTSRDFLTPRAPRPGVSSPSSAPGGDFHVTPQGGVAMPSSHSHAPLPDIPSGTLTALLSASASAGGGALVILLAVLAAAPFLAAPGLGRRLRPRLAPWPQPILNLSLERPG